MNVAKYSSPSHGLSEQLDVWCPGGACRNLLCFVFSDPLDTNTCITNYSEREDYNWQPQIKCFAQSWTHGSSKNRCTNCLVVHWTRTTVLHKDELCIVIYSLLICSAKNTKVLSITRAILSTPLCLLPMVIRTKHTECTCRLILRTSRDNLLLSIGPVTMLPLWWVLPRAHLHFQPLIARETSLHILSGTRRMILLGLLAFCRFVPFRFLVLPCIFG
jgi:hypothetical protein